jgi:hypothetical protein
MNKPKCKLNKPKCKLVGTDGNAFAIIFKVARALRLAELPKEAKEFTDKAMASASYEALLCLCMEYVEVT